MKRTQLIIVVCVLLLCSCGQRRNLVYFSNMTKQSSDEEIQYYAIKIQKDDVLKINVNSLNEEFNQLFTINRQSLGTSETVGYKVSKEGMVNLPVLGNVFLEGFTSSQAQDALVEKFLKYVKEPIVEVDLLNFKITVIGEVNKPSSFNVSGDQINLLEALGMAGDMTVYGQRNNVLIIREENGRRIMKRLDLNQSDVFNSPFFNLKQNDIVYVEPDKSKAIEYSSSTRTLPIVIASISAVAVLISAILRN